MAQFISRFTTFDGRLNRSKFWIGLLFMGAIGVACVLLLMAVGLGESHTVQGVTELSTGERNEFTKTSFVLNPWVNLALSALLMVPTAAIAIKRRHDRDGFGADVMGFFGLTLVMQLLTALGVSNPTLGMVLGLISSLLFIYLFVLLGCLKGTSGDNRYGPDPLAAGKS